jgi:hypothetical protein
VTCCLREEAGLIGVEGESRIVRSGIDTGRTVADSVTAYLLGSTNCCLSRGVLLHYRIIRAGQQTFDWPLSLHLTVLGCFELATCFTGRFLTC